MIGLPDTPALSTRDMQAKFEETGREVIIPRFNSLVETLTENGTPVKSSDVAGLKKGEDGDILALCGEEWRPLAPGALAKKADRTDTYTKAETEKAISDRIVEIGSADMSKAVYDKDNDGTVDDAKRLCGMELGYFRQRPQVISARISASRWQGEGPYTRTVPAEGIKEGDSPVADVLLPEEGSEAVKAISAFGCISGIKTMEGQIRAVCLSEKPESDVTVRFLVMR